MNGLDVICTEYLTTKSYVDYLLSESTNAVMYDSIEWYPFALDNPVLSRPSNRLDRNKKRKPGSSAPPLVKTSEGLCLRISSPYPSGGRDVSVTDSRMTTEQGAMTRMPLMTQYGVMASS